MFQFKTICALKFHLKSIKFSLFFSCTQLKRKKMLENFSYKGKKRFWEMSKI